MRRSSTALALLGLAIVCPAGAGDDALPIVKKALEAALENEALARRYVFHERIEQRRFNGKGEVKKREATTYEVTLLDHSEYRRRIAVDDRPPGPKMVAQEQRKLEEQIRKMRNETPKQRAKRLARVEKSREEGKKFLEEITRAFDFRRIGEQEVDGVLTHVILAEPREGYKPTSRETKVLPEVQGTLWISQEDHAWVQAELETLGNIRWAVIFKLHEGAQVRFKQRRIHDEVWMTDHWYVRLRARAALLFKFNGEITGSYSNFRRFTTDSTLIEGPAGQ